MKKYILHTLYSALGICGMSLLVLCAACTEQDGLPSADPQPLTLAIGETIPFVKATGGTHTRVADSGTALTWENGDKIYLAATITASGGATTYAYSTATYTISGSTGTWSDPDPALSAPSGTTVNIEAIYAKGTLSGNILTPTANSVIMKATATGITVNASTAAIPLKFQSALVRLEVTGIVDASNTVTASSFNIPQSIDTQPANGSFTITPTAASNTLTQNGVYYALPGDISLTTLNKKTIDLAAADVKANQSYPIDMSSENGTIRPDGEPFV